MSAYAFVTPHPRARHIPDAGTVGQCTSQPDDREQYAARRAYAYERGERAAIQRAISAEAYLFLYKELVRLCKDRTFCWAGVEWMAQRLNVSEGTIKRWLRQLVEAGLIQRTPRPGGDTALTNIPALIEYDAQHSSAFEHDQPLTGAPLAAADAPPSPSSQVTTDVAPLFFAPAEGIESESRTDSYLIRHTLKKRKRIPGLVGSPGVKKDCVSSTHPAADKTAEMLARIGVCGPGVLDELSTFTHEEIGAICRYVAQQRNSYNPAGLVVFLARSGFGRTLLCTTRRSGTSDLVTRSSANIQITAPSGSNQPLDRRGDGASLRPLDDLWARVQVQLAQHVPTDEFATWLQETHLVALEDESAVVGVPTIFAREQVQSIYQQKIADVITHLTGTPVLVNVVIDRQE